MARADCPFCEASGYRACDVCGNPVFPPIKRTALGLELCAYCIPVVATDLGQITDKQSAAPEPA
jgi:hypothetical protein